VGVVRLQRGSGPGRGPAWRPARFVGYSFRRRAADCWLAPPRNGCTNGKPTRSGRYFGLRSGPGWAINGRVGIRQTVSRVADRAFADSFCYSWWSTGKAEGLDMRIRWDGLSGRAWRRRHHSAAISSPGRISRITRLTMRLKEYRRGGQARKSARMVDGNSGQVINQLNRPSGIGIGE